MDTGPPAGGQRDTGMMPDPGFHHMLAPFSGRINNGNTSSGSRGNQQFDVNPDGMAHRILGQPSKVSNNSRACNRSLTPTQEDLQAQLQKFGACRDIMSGDILEAARRHLHESSSYQGAHYRRKPIGFSPRAAVTPPDKSSEAGLSDSFSDSTEHSASPTTPESAVHSIGFSGAVIPGFALDLPNGTSSTRENRAIGASTRSACTVNRSHDTSSIKSAGQIDPYIPITGSLLPESTSLWPGSNNNDEHPGKAVPVLNPVKDVGAFASKHGSDSPGASASLASQQFRFPPVVGPQRASMDKTMSPDSHRGPVCRHHEQMNARLQHLEYLLALSGDKLEYSCNRAMKQITIREAEIAGLKRQLRQQNLLPFNEHDTTDDQFFEKEFGMLFRLLCCWGKRFYKFPTGEAIPRGLRLAILQICEDPYNERFLLGRNQTKHLVVVALAARWMVDEILNPQFLDTAVELVKNCSVGSDGHDSREVAEGIKGNAQAFI